jgi:signal transduction histidine kinase
VRIAAVAFLVVAVALGAGGVGLVLWVHHSAFGNLVTLDTEEASEVGALASSGSLPATLPARAGVAVQVVNAKGRVLSSSADLIGHEALSGIRPRPGQREILRTVPVFRADDDTDLTVASTVKTRGGTETVYATTSVEQVENSTHLLILALLVLLPVLVVLSGVFAWVLAGLALRPVEALREELSDITANKLHRRVPEPSSEDEIGRLARTMNEMLARLEESNDRQRRFVSDASHELRSPLAALLAQVEVAQARSPAVDWTAVATTVIHEGERIASLVDDLLLLARSDEGQLVPGRDLVDLDEILFTEVRRLRAIGTIRVDCHGVSAGRVLGDREQLRRMVRNLTDNAERHASSLVRFELHSLDEGVELVVADDGPGIPDDMRDQVFERFSRLDTARNRATGGTGLGLAIVGEIAMIHRGTARVATSEKGARLVVWLPERWTDEDRASP